MGLSGVTESAPTTWTRRVWRSIDIDRDDTIEASLVQKANRIGIAN